MYDWLDGLLPEIRQREFQAHLDYCSVCYREVQEAKHVLAALATLKKPAATPPPNFTASVMNRLREEEKVVYERRFMQIPIRSLAMAASMLFLLGINTIVLGGYRAGGLITLKLAPVTDSTSVEKPSTPSVIAQKPVEKPVNQDNETPEPELPREDPVEVTVDDPVEVSGDITEAPVDTRAEPIEPAAVIVEPPVETVPPVVEKPSTPNDKLSEEDLVVEAPQPVTNREVNLQNLVLPDPEIFSTQKRVVEGTMVKLDVQHLETASQMLVSNATMQGLIPTVDYTVLTTDGRLIWVYQYDVPFTQVNKFVTGTTTLGRLITEERSQNDMTGEYTQKLAQYEELVEKSLGAKGEEVEQLNQEINKLVQELSEMDKNIRNTQKVIVWLES
jgi:hypothetical protein